MQSDIQQLGDFVTAAEILETIGNLLEASLPWSKWICIGLERWRHPLTAMLKSWYRVPTAEDVFLKASQWMEHGDAYALNLRRRLLDEMAADPKVLSWTARTLDRWGLGGSRWVRVRGNQKAKLEREDSKNRREATIL